MDGGTTRGRAAGLLGWLLLGAACLHGFYALGNYYGGFDIPQGTGIQHVPQAEVVFAGWYLLVGTLAATCFAAALFSAGLADRMLAAVHRLLAAPRALVWACALVVLAGATAFRALVLRGQVVTDDELVYEFIAATLLQGRVANDPPIALEFLKNHYVIAAEHGWYGKYPIGHPLLLALGGALGAAWLVPPLLGALGVLLTFAIGRGVVGERRAALACALLALSPHYVWTHATLLSQSTAMLCMLLAVLGLLRLADTGALRWAALTGAGLGYGILARPFPGVLFAIAAAVAFLAARGALVRSRPGRFAAEAALSGAGTALGVGAVLAVNYLQSGDMWTSGYHTIHGSAGFLKVSKEGVIAASLAGALLRENLWLHGWPLSLAFVPFARFARGALPVWGMIAASVAYRVLVPKTVVSTTGPTYTLEIVPLLCLATVAGAARCAEWLDRAWLGRERARAAIAAAVAGATLVALALFVPVQLRSVHRAGLARTMPYALLRDVGVERAVVFASLFVMPGSGVSWAHMPPNPAPALDEDLVFLRMLPGHDGYERMLALWRTRFPDRRALLLIMTPEGLVLRELPVRPEDPLPAEIVWARPR